MKVFTVDVKPPSVLVTFYCLKCKLTNAGSMPTKASYSDADMARVAQLVARVSARPCGCAP